jgi:hypothetical protein
MQALCRIVANELSHSTETLRFAHNGWLYPVYETQTPTGPSTSPSHFTALMKGRKSRQTRLHVNKLVLPYDVGQEYSDALYYHINLVRKVAGIFPLLTLPWVASNMLHTYEGESKIIRNVATYCEIGYTAGWA